MRRFLSVNRYSGAVEEEINLHKRSLRFLYLNPIGQLLESLFCCKKIFSMILGWFASRPFSKKKIPSFVRKHGLKIDSFEKSLDEFSSFNDFFSRKLKPSARPISPKPEVISAPTDGRFLAYPNMEKFSPFFVKGESLNVRDLILDTDIAKKFVNGSILISRLGLSDYHRFHFPVDCTPDTTFLINGNYSSVHPYAINGTFATFLQNKRMSTLLHTKNCGDIIMIEIGAIGVGTIKQTFSPATPMLKGDEKGYFELGGSTVILIFENGRIKFSNDILKNTSEGLETYILMGDEVASILS